MARSPDNISIHYAVGIIAIVRYFSDRPEAQMQGFDGILGCYRNGPHTTQPGRNDAAREARLQEEREQHLLSLFPKQDGLSGRLCIFERWQGPFSGKKWQHSG